MAIVIEWTRSENNVHRMHVYGRYMDIRFVPQARYCGARAVAITDPTAIRHFDFQSGFRRYTGPIIEFIPEGVASVEEMDWERFVDWTTKNAPADVIEAIAGYMPDEAVVDEAEDEAEDEAHNPDDVPESEADDIIQELYMTAEEKGYSTDEVDEYIIERYGNSPARLDIQTLKNALGGFKRRKPRE